MSLIEMTYDEWVERFDPIDNTDGTIFFETYGEDLEFINANDYHYVWTVYDDDSITEGRHFVNRLNYCVTLTPWKEGDAYSIIDPDLDRLNEEAQL